MDKDALLQTLAPDRRMALGYAPRAVRGHFLALYALDARLGSVVAAAREPMLAQLKLAWWHEQLAKDPALRPAGEPVLAALASWGQDGSALTVLVDGWEGLLGEDPAAGDVVAAFVEARAEACSALASALGCDAEQAARAGYNWALNDLAAMIGPGSAIISLSQASDWSKPRLSRELRPLLVHHTQARFNKDNQFSGAGLGGFITSVRVGLLGI